jgi:hypothetical protein
LAKLRQAEEGLLARTSITLVKGDQRVIGRIRINFETTGQKSTLLAGDIRKGGGVEKRHIDMGAETRQMAESRARAKGREKNKGRAGNGDGFIHLGARLG